MQAADQGTAIDLDGHALVIGIDEYDNADWNLTGAVADATAFAEWVVKAGGVDPANLTLLLSPVGNVPNAKRATADANCGQSPAGFRALRVRPVKTW